MNGQRRARFLCLRHHNLPKSPQIYGQRPIQGGRGHRALLHGDFESPDNTERSCNARYMLLGKKDIDLRCSKAMGLQAFDVGAAIARHLLQSPISERESLVISRWQWGRACAADVKPLSGSEAHAPFLLAKSRPSRGYQIPSSTESRCRRETWLLALHQCLRKSDLRNLREDWT